MLHAALLAVSAVLQLVGAAVASAGSEGARVEREAWVMGTRLGIVVEAPRRADAARAAETALREVERVESLVSSWESSTPLGELNHAAPYEWSPVGPELAALLSEVDELSSLTRGAFEHRIGALVDAWDLRGPGRIPTPDELISAEAATGPAGVQLMGRFVRRAPAAWIDSGAFGKGAALRSVERLLRESASDSRVRALVDLGGQVLALAPDGVPWPIHVAHPLRRSEPLVALALEDGSVATSGTSERGQHILDPRTGRPVDAWGSVTVVHADALAADALSTALYVMGPEEGFAWAEEAGVAALLVTLDEGATMSLATSAIEPWLIDMEPTQRNERNGP